MCVAAARATGLGGHVAAGHDVLAAGRRVVAASVDATCWPTRELNGSDPATCSTRREGPDHHRSRDAVDDARYHCSSGCNRALERGRPRSEMRKGYVRSPSTIGTRAEVAARCGEERDIQRLSQTPCRGALAYSTIITLMALQNHGYCERLPTLFFRPSSLTLLSWLWINVWPAPKALNQTPPDPSSLLDRQSCP